MTSASTPPPPPPPPPVPTLEPVNPKRGRGFLRWGIGLIATALTVVLLAVIGIIVAGVFFANSGTNVSDALKDAPRMSVPGVETLELPQGEQQVWLIVSGSEPPGRDAVSLEIRDATTLELVTVEPGASTEFFVNTPQNESVVLVGRVFVPSSGTYFVTANGKPGGTIAFGGPDFSGLLGSIATFFVAMVVGVPLVFLCALLGMVGFVLLIVGIVLRSDTKRRLALGAPPGS